MAKLSARNRQTDVEVVREYTADQLQRRRDRVTASYTPDYVAGSDPSLIVWERTTRRLMSDGKILEKRDVRFRPSPHATWEDPNGRRHSYGWKVKGTLQSGLTAADFARVYSEPTKTGSPSPWTVTRKPVVAKAVILSQRRIRAAVQSGESIGFCTECGADQHGVEPDAEGYRCASCGQMAVTGAENLLRSL